MPQGHKSSREKSSFCSQRSFGIIQKTTRLKTCLKKYLKPLCSRVFRKQPTNPKFHPRITSVGGFNYWYSQTPQNNEISKEMSPQRHSTDSFTLASDFKKPSNLNKTFLHEKKSSQNKNLFPLPPSPPKKNHLHPDTFNTMTIAADMYSCHWAFLLRTWSAEVGSLL